MVSGKLSTSEVNLLNQAVGIALEYCLSCGGEFMIIAPILEPSVIERILTYLGVQALAPPQRRCPATLNNVG